MIGKKCYQKYVELCEGVRPRTPVSEQIIAVTIILIFAELPP
jgi:hypothetical protein